MKRMGFLLLALFTFAFYNPAIANSDESGSEEQSGYENVNTDQSEVTPCVDDGTGNCDMPVITGKDTETATDNAVNDPDTDSVTGTDNDEDTYKGNVITDPGATSNPGDEANPDTGSNSGVENTNPDNGATDDSSAITDNSGVPNSEEDNDEKQAHTPGR